mmetsp:Transcript_76201/g.211809  ORF Transcript_76201/g.211809 Transcript_76201/m.211809 type:complete len:217 (+) Transcript_76201:675-1325(+)
MARNCHRSPTRTLLGPASQGRRPRAVARNRPRPPPTTLPGPASLWRPALALARRRPRRRALARTRSRLAPRLPRLALAAASSKYGQSPPLPWRLQVVWALAPPSGLQVAQREIPCKPGASGPAPTRLTPPARCSPSPRDWPGTPLRRGRKGARLWANSPVAPGQPTALQRRQEPLTQGCRGRDKPSPSQRGTGKRHAASCTRAPTTLCTPAQRSRR